MFAETLRQKLSGLCSLSEGQIQQLEGHYHLLCRWNKVLNLTSVRAEDEIIERHYCESLFLALHLPERPLRIADVGSGAGFPGFPVATLRPDCQVTLIESHQRKAVFLKEASRQIPNLTIVSRRVEDMSHGERQHFDWAISRAVRYRDIYKSLVRLASNAAILTGEVSLDEVPGFAWKPPIRLPWGENRFLLVSRETGSVIA